MDATRAPSDEKLYDDEKRPATSNVEAGPGIHVDTQDVYDGAESGVDPVYLAKARVLNEAIQEIGMGKYQVGCLCFPADQSIDLPVVVLVHRRWLWMVLVSSTTALSASHSYILTTETIYGPSSLDLSIRQW